MLEPTRQRLELILRQVDSLPTLPGVAVQVLQVASSQDASAKDVCRTIENDPALAVRILKLVHRADAGVSGEVTSLDRAVLLLGFEAVRCAVLAVSVFATYGPTKANADNSFAVNYWKHSVAVGACAELLAGELVTNWGRDAGVTPGEAFLAGLLHDIGKLALDMTVPKSFAKVVEAVDLLRSNIADVERSVIGVDHQVVGKRLAELWGLPAVLRDAIWLHGQVPQALPASVRNPRLVNLVTLADLLVREQHLGYSGNYQFPVTRESLMNALGMLPPQIDNVLNNLVAAIESRAKTIGLGTGGQSDLYRAAIQEANKELTRMTDQLAVRNRRLTIRSKYFEAVAAFQSELRPDAPPATVLHAIAQTAAAVLEASAVAAFSLPPGAGYAEVAVVDASGQLLHTNLIDAESGDLAVPAGRAPQRPGHADGPVSAAGADLEWLLATFSPKLNGVGRYWIALEADGVCVGGVVWGAPPEEQQRLSPQTQELSALASGWSLALRTCQIRDESRALAEQLAEVNRRLQTAQSEIYRTRMLTSVAQIAAGAAHEMNNPLMVISGRSQLLASTLDDPKHRDAAKQIFEKSQTLSDLITALMHFAKPQPPQPAPCDVAGLFRLAVEKAQQIAPSGTRQVETKLPDLPPANVDGGQIAEALAEIIANAVQATEENGRIVLSGSFDAFGQRLVLTVADNGRGMDANTLAHAFDPFFSMKTAGRQQGMGLSKAQRWAESSQGSMRLESQPGQGTRVIMILPAGAPADAAARPLRSVSM